MHLAHPSAAIPSTSTPANLDQRHASREETTMEAPRRFLLALAVGGISATASPADARRQEHRDPGARYTALGRIWVLQSEGAGRALRLLRLFVDGRDVGSAGT